MSTAYVGLGSNLDEPDGQVERALVAIDGLPASRLSRRSSLYRSAPWGMTEQPEFINAVAELETGLTPQMLMQALLDIEREFGRRRELRWGPRILDLDLLLYADAMLDEPGLRVPHPHLHERAFVLLPLAEISPRLHIPGHGTVEELLQEIDSSTCSIFAPA